MGLTGEAPAVRPRKVQVLERETPPAWDVQVLALVAPARSPSPGARPCPGGGLMSTVRNSASLCGILCLLLQRRYG